MKNRLLIADRRPGMRWNRQQPGRRQYVQEGIDDRIRTPIDGPDGLKRTVNKNHITSAKSGFVKE